MFRVRANTSLGFIGFRLSAFGNRRFALDLPWDIFYKPFSSLIVLARELTLQGSKAVSRLGAWGS